MARLVRRRAPTGREAPHVLVIVENVALGIDTRLRKQVWDLVAAGYRVSVVTRAAPENDEFRGAPGVIVMEYPPPPEPRRSAGYAWEYGLSLAWAVAYSVRTRLRGRIDVLQLCQPPDIYFPLAWLLRRLGAGVVVDQRDLMPETFGRRQERPARAVTALLRWLERRTQGAADWTMTVNEYLAERLLESGAQAERTTLVRNGPVLARVRAAAASESWRDGRSFLCCWAGKMGRQDRLDLLLGVVDFAVHDLGATDVRFVVLGDGECLDQARALSGRLGLDPWVSFPGWVPESAVFSCLASADVGLDASLQQEVTPVKVLEYMASGVPFVAFDLQETRAIGQGAGAFAPPGDVPALARQLVLLLDDAPRRAALADIGRRRVCDELAWEHQAQAYLSVIGELVRPRPGPVLRPMAASASAPPVRPTP